MWPIIANLGPLNSYKRIVQIPRPWANYIFIIPLFFVCFLMHFCWLRFQETRKYFHCIVKNSGGIFLLCVIIKYNFLLIEFLREMQIVYLDTW